ncbi:hypothetical protein FW778_14455 [Ginsengibacter hankyongi]|uniref:Methylamine utilisation protein MauE domain-containing protein n=1 Tax=Ginsengibacter hankyongi TaxID=2607284 RepID=A0A5J5IFS7_9BACT|nr:MauE/DoxX family redox-associated membrane protein [Ginsengibacter hankyongi]KAA9038742.1 hypothetical protein FW778_14455 [Ginsengibacter hankyongi]
MKAKFILEILCFLLVLLFVYAGFSKLMDYNAFKAQLSNSPFIKNAAGILAWVLPVIEIGSAALLTVRITRLYGLIASMMLLLAFTGYISAMLLSGVHLPCSCGGVIKQLSWNQHLLFNLFFISIAGIGIVLKQKLNYHL